MDYPKKQSEWITQRNNLNGLPKQTISMDYPKKRSEWIYPKKQSERITQRNNLNDLGVFRMETAVRVEDINLLLRLTPRQIAVCCVYGHRFSEEPSADSDNSSSSNGNSRSSSSSDGGGSNSSTSNIIFVG